MEATRYSGYHGITEKMVTTKVEGVSWDNGKWKLLKYNENHEMMEKWKLLGIVGIMGYWKMETTRVWWVS